MQAKRFEILETLDISKGRPELKEDFKTWFLPLLRKLVPNGEEIQMVHLDDPPRLEIRRPVG
jgi:hypothetical protein